MAFGDIPVTIVGVTMKSLRLDSRDFHDPLVQDLLTLGLLERVDPRRGGRAYMERLHVNYLRHNGVNLGGPGYQELLDQGSQRLGFHVAYHEVNRLILDAIAERIPQLVDACAAQRGEEYLVEPEDIFRPYMRADADGLIPLSVNGATTVEARKVQRLDAAMRTVPTLTPEELARFSASYHEGIEQPKVADDADRSSGDMIIEAKVAYLRDRALGFDRRNVNHDRNLLGADPEQERIALLAIARKYPALHDECQRRVRLLDR